MPFPKGQGKQQEAAEGKEDVCGICGQEVDREDEYILGHCVKCGEVYVHPECIASLQSRVETHNSRSREKQIVKAKHHPEQVFERMKCPVNLYKGEDSPDRCTGKIVQGEFKKLAKAPAPPPPTLPPRAPPARAKSEGAAAGGAKAEKANKAAAPKKTASLPKVISNAGGAPLASAGGSGAWVTVGRGAGAASRLHGAGPGGGKRQEVPGMPRSKSIGSQASSSGGGGHSGLRFAHGTRPKELTLCPHWRECGECFVYRCEYAHGEEEVAEREEAWLADQKRKQEAERRAQLDEHKKRLAAEAAERGTQPAPAAPAGAWGRGGTGSTGAALLHASSAGGGAADAAAPGPAAGSAVEADFLQLSGATLGLMKEHKRRHCINTLLEMGFGNATAEGAANATGCEAERAVQLVMDGGVVIGAPPKPVDVAGEAQSLLATARGLGLGVQDVEMELILMEGNWAAAAETLEARVLGGAAAQASAFQPASQVPHASQASIHPSEWSEAATPIPLSPTPSQAAALAAVLPPGTTASSTPRSSYADNSWANGAGGGSTAAAAGWGGAAEAHLQQAAGAEAVPEWRGAHEAAGWGGAASVQVGVPVAVASPQTTTLASLAGKISSTGGLGASFGSAVGAVQPAAQGAAGAYGGMSQADPSTASSFFSAPIVGPGAAGQQQRQQPQQHSHFGAGWGGLLDLSTVAAGTAGSWDAWVTSVPAPAAPAAVAAPAAALAAPLAPQYGDGYRAGYEAARQQQQQHFASTGLDIYTAVGTAGGYAAQPAAQAGAANWGVLLGEGAAPVSQRLPVAAAQQQGYYQQQQYPQQYQHQPDTAIPAGKGAVGLWGAPGGGGTAEEDAELQDMLSLLCT